MIKILTKLQYTIGPILFLSMPKILALDIGGKRTGIAHTDPMQMIASPLCTVPTGELLAFVKAEVLAHDIVDIVIGAPRQMDGSVSESAAFIEAMAEKLEANHPGITVHWVDERFTSKMAAQSLVTGGMKKGKRQEKGQLDQVAAAIILQSFLEQR